MLQKQGNQGTWLHNCANLLVGIIEAQMKKRCVIAVYVYSEIINVQFALSDEQLSLVWGKHLKVYFLNIFWYSEPQVIKELKAGNRPSREQELQEAEEGPVLFLPVGKWIGSFNDM